MANNNNQPSNTDLASNGTRPSISLPKGGGALRSIDEKLSVNPATGTSSLVVPIYTSPGRSGFDPELQLQYSSGSGNGSFGLGWQLNQPTIKRRTDKRIPRYLDDTDIFVLSGQDDLVPVSQEPDKNISDDQFWIQQYRPRVERSFDLIQKYTDRSNGAVHWMVTSKSNEVSIFGRSSDHKIMDPENPDRVFEWLLEERRDSLGNVIYYEYKPEDYQNVAGSLASESNRIQQNLQRANRYLKRISYGNQEPFVADDWHFEVIFDYGDQDQPDESQQWPVRPDPFSQYRSGFEIRTYRRCERILVYHRFADLGDEPVLVRSTDFQYQDDPVASRLLSITQQGFITEKINGNSEPVSEKFPSLDFQYHPLDLDLALKPLSPESRSNLPIGVDNSQYQFVDLLGSGLPGILAEIPDHYLFKQNLGDANFSSVAKIKRTPGHRKSPQARLKFLISLETGPRTWWFWMTRAPDISNQTGIWTGKTLSRFRSRRQLTGMILKCDGSTLPATARRIC